MRLKGVIAYDGSRFEGFQSQKHTSNTVVGTLHAALKRMGIETKVVGSGRTDRGVHATMQVIHFDLPPFWSDIEKLRNYLQTYCEPYIQIKRLYGVDSSFHARYSAKRRAYRYIITHKKPSPFEAAYLTYNPPLDRELLTKGLSLFVGRHDFSYFMKSGSDTKSALRTIYRAKLYEYEGKSVIYIEADGFLRAQVRMMVDFLLKIARGELSLTQLQEQLTLKKRHSTTLAPPNGLYLSKVIYSTKAALI
ncbi:MAG: tRNA pseudouridine(38-40) synthase TruA [Epsilonproteobacteria bacterium]|nr:tRNA pseudouridine(38-40) synthase TruA [Campylobacterota bacterium]NPA63796.1 tRNA pseudouridine(38-40) synthase TruA [Campylobacterota bacterium]